MTSSIEEALTALRSSGQVIGVTEAPTAIPAASASPPLPVPIYTNDSLVEYLVANPGCTPELIAAAFGQPKRWFLSILATDSFQLALDSKRHLLSDPAITATMEERFRALSLQSLDVLQRKLESKDASDLLVLKASELGVKALGMGMAPTAAPVLTPVAGIDTLAERLVAALEKQRRNVRGAVTIDNTTTVEVDCGS